MPERSAERPASAAIWNWRTERMGEDAAALARTALAARRRGLLRGGAGLAVAAALLLWKPVLGVVAGGGTLVLLAIAVVSPGGLYPRVERGIAVFARAVGLAVSWVTLTVVFFLVFWPLGLVLRALGKLRLEPGLDRSAVGYWRAPDTVGAWPERHDRQF